MVFLKKMRPSAKILQGQKKDGRKAVRDLFARSACPVSKTICHISFGRNAPASRIGD
jgi:hypothetical protein